MATNRDIIVRTIAAFLPELLTNGAELRKVAEYTVAQRKLSWEEWLDIRDAWARYYNALVVVVLKGDDKAIQRAEEQAVRQGYEYLLLDYVS